MTAAEVFSTRPIALLLLALAGCQAPAPGNTVAAASQSDGNTIASVLALPPGQLDVTLFRAIRAANQDCQQVTEAKRLDDLDGSPAWFATCGPQSHYLVVIGADGIAQVTDARRVRSIAK